MHEHENEPGDGGAGAGGSDAGKVVPYERFQTAVREKQEMAAEVATLKTEVQGLAERAATAGTLASELEAWKTKAAEAEGRLGRYKAIGSALDTSDPDAIEAVEWQYGKLPEEGRPELEPWLTDLKAKPEEAPAVLRPWLQPSDGGGDGKAKPAPRRHDAGGGGPGGGAGNGVITDEKVRQVRQRYISTGNWEPWKELKKQMNRP